MQRYIPILLPLIILFPFLYGDCGGQSSNGDTQAAFISGVVFDDANVNGTMDPAEDPIPGVVIQVSGISSNTQAVTDMSGFYRAKVAEAGTCMVTEQDPPDHLSTNSIPGSDGWKVDVNNLGVVVLEVDITAGKEFTGYNFGDRNLGQMSPLLIKGSAWIDSNANGALDAGEDPLAGAWVALSTGPAMWTDTDGEFMIFASVTPGVIVTVQVTHPQGYVPTNAVPGIGGTRYNSTTIVVQSDQVPLDVAEDVYISSGNQFGAVVP
jgi:hypothetical protein